MIEINIEKMVEVEFIV